MECCCCDRVFCVRREKKMKGSIKNEKRLRIKGGKKEERRAVVTDIGRLYHTSNLLWVCSTFPSQNK